MHFLFCFFLNYRSNHPRKGKHPFPTEVIQAFPGILGQRSRRVRRAGTEVDKGIKSSCSEIRWLHTEGQQMGNVSLPASSKYLHKALAWLTLGI